MMVPLSDAELQLIVSSLAIANSDDYPINNDTQLDVNDRYHRRRALMTKLEKERK